MALLEVPDGGREDDVVGQVRGAGLRHHQDLVLGVPVDDVPEDPAHGRRQGHGRFREAILSGEFRPRGRT